MSTLLLILKLAVVTVLSASLLEALVLSWRHARGLGPAYDWKASAISVVDFLVREYPLRLLLPLGFWLGWMDWLYAHRLLTLRLDHWSGWVGCFLLQEFCYYWYHRAAHRVRWFWTQHVAHHTGEIMNMSTAARQSILNGFVGTWFFYIPAVLIGFTPELILGLLGANLAFQWFVHTEAVGKLHPWIEWWINTPSNHRVHHGRNVQYIDKNYGGVIMLYDHLFGTYEPEQEKVEYGTPRQIKSHNWLVLNLHEFVDMMRDVMAPGPLGQRLKHLWKPPAWQRDGHDPVHTWTVERYAEASEQ